MTSLCVCGQYRHLAEEDQLLRALGTGNTKITNPRALEFRRMFNRMYYNFKPHKTYWIICVMGRKFGIAVTALMFQKNPAFQMSVRES
jgi:hypothetical protein